MGILYLLSSVVICIFFFESLIAHIFLLVIGSVYVSLMLPGALTGGNELNRTKLIEALEPNWRNATRIADFTIKYWYSMKYIMSANARAGNISIISLISFLLAIAFFIYDFQWWMIIWALVNGVLLIPACLRLNKILSVLHHTPESDEWPIACAALAAMADFLDNENMKFVLNEMLPQEKVSLVLLMYQK